MNARHGKLAPRAVDAAFLVGLAALAVSGRATACPLGVEIDLWEPTARCWPNAAYESCRRTHTLHDGPHAAPVVGAVTGAVDHASVARTLKRHADRLAGCERADSQGTLIVTLRITPTGAPTNVAVAGVDPAVARCMAGVLGELAFPGRGTDGFARIVLELPAPS